MQVAWRVDREDKEALGDSPAEEPTVVRVLLGILAAILIIGLVVVFAVIMRKKDKVDASAGGSVDRRLGLGLLQRPLFWNHNDQRKACSTLLHSAVIVQHATNQAKSTSGACPSA